MMHIYIWKQWEIFRYGINRVTLNVGFQFAHKSFNSDLFLHHKRLRIDGDLEFSIFHAILLNFFIIVIPCRLNVHISTFSGKARYHIFLLSINICMQFHMHERS